MQWINWNTWHKISAAVICAGGILKVIDDMHAQHQPWTAIVVAAAALVHGFTGYKSTPA